MKFYDRREAAKLLAKKLEKYKRSDAAVYALPRGGVVLGAEIAKHLDVPLDLVITRKIGHPDYAEYAICAVTEAGDLICNQNEIAKLNSQWLKQAILKEQKEAQRRRKLYLASRPRILPEGKIAILIDDGVATGLTIRVAIEAIKKQKPAKIVLAIPVIPSDIAEQFSKLVNEIMALDIADNYKGSVGSYYQKFDQVEDAEVIRLLDS